MTWVISLILLAVAAYFLISALSSKNNYDLKNQTSDAEISEGESAQLDNNATSSDAFQNAGGAPAGASSSAGNTTDSSASANTASSGAAAGSAGGGSGASSGAASANNGASNGSSSGASVAGGAAAVGVTAAAAIASAREHNLKGVTGNSIGEIQEMLKILNLRDSDAGRLAINKDQYAALKSGASDMGATELASVADKLRWMLR